MSTYSPNCSIPSEVVNYVSSANTRGTLDILWSCLSVLVLCTWTIQHLNVPAQTRPRTNTQKLRLRLHSFFWKLKWMVLTAIAPECLLGKALVDLLSAWYSCDEMKAFAEKEKIDWTMKHAYFANIGGFGLLFDDSVTKKLKTTAGPQDESNHREGMHESLLVKCDNTVLPGTANEYTESISPLYRNARLLAKQSHASMQLSNSMENESTAPASEQASMTQAPAIDTTPSTPCKSGAHQPQVHSPEVAAAGATVEAKILSNTAPLKRRDLSHDFNEDGTPIDDFGKKLDSLSRHYGTEDWSPNETNRRLVMQGMQQLSTQGQSLRLRSRQRNIMSLQGSIWILDAAQLRRARELGILERLPHIHEQNLEDQNKGDVLLKALAVLQVLWLIATLIIRAARRLPSSQLELLVAAFAGCSFVIYALFWNKPKDVSTTRYITAARYPTSHEILDLASEGPSTFFHYRKGYWIPNNAVHRMGSQPLIPAAGAPFSENDKLDSQPRTTFLVGGIIGAVVFGAPHLAAWSFVFPTPAEQLLWRIAALATVFIPLVGALVDTIYSQLYQRAGRRRARARQRPGVFQTRYLQTISAMLWFFALPYLLARLYIIVEVFRCLCYLPPEAYITTWAAGVPHLN